uniref:Uncharacterized protein n=1 Tax=Nelumbo nucifera TaxID=4432 RepID=A0A822YX15_NELNU|nr:TPA_asm: hypothetical protein HUJ06_006519 [Nelumbo nucifera]
MAKGLEEVLTDEDRRALRGSKFVLLPLSPPPSRTQPRFVFRLGFSVLL